MTNQEAINQFKERLKTWDRLGVNDDVSDYLEAMKMAIKALENSTTVEKSQLASSCNDPISRQKAIDAFDGAKVNEDNCTEYDIGYNDGIDYAVSKLSVLPSVQLDCSDCIQYGGDWECDRAYCRKGQLKRKKGEWIDGGSDGTDVMGIEHRWHICSVCGNTISKAPFQKYPNFCSTCGADMKGE